jgi:hypothetical protein
MRGGFGRPIFVWGGGMIGAHSPMIRTPRLARIGLALLLFAGLFDVPPARAQSNQGFGKLNLFPHAGLIVGAVIGVAAGIVVGVTILILHERHKGIVVGCIAEAGGKRTLEASNKKVYALSDGGPALPVGDRAKLKGHKSGPRSAPAFQVDTVLRDYGHCQP